MGELPNGTEPEILNATENVAQQQLMPSQLSPPMSDENGAKLLMTSDERGACLSFSEKQMLGSDS